MIILFVVVIVVVLLLLHLLPRVCCGGHSLSSYSEQLFIFSITKLQAAIFMGFSITSAVMGGIIIIIYSLSIAFHFRYGAFYDSRYRYNTGLAVAVIILLLGIVEFAIGIWAAICCCLMQICCCRPPLQQVSMLSFIKHIVMQCL